MINSPSRPQVYIGPEDDQLIAEAVEGAGADLVGAPDEADSFVWLSPSIVDLERALHSDVRWVQLKSAGIDHVLRSGLVDANRVWTCARGVYAAAVAEHGLTLMLAATRRLHEIIPARNWGDPGTRFGKVLSGSNVTILGCGAIGEALIALLGPFGVTITAVTRSGREVEGATSSLPSSRSDEVLGADFVVLAAPSTPESVGMIDAQRLRSMSPDGWLINIGRGDLVRTDDLVDALRMGAIAGAALDVTDPQPLPDDHSLWAMPNVIITPHTANPPSENSLTLANRVRENLRRLQSGQELLGVIDPERDY